MTINEFKATVLKKYAARYQVNYLRQSPHKPSSTVI